MTTPGKLEFKEYIPHPPSKVWKALTVPEVMKKWWVNSDIDSVVGHKFTLDMGGWGKQQCEVVAVENERMISYLFSNFSKITWLLSPEGDGTSLTLIHDGFDLDSPIARQAYEGMGKGWPSLIARIAEAL